jgi:hypothetical protein
MQAKRKENQHVDENKGKTTCRCEGRENTHKLCVVMSYHES